MTTPPTSDRSLKKPKKNRIHKKDPLGASQGTHGVPPNKVTPEPRVRLRGQSFFSLATKLASLYLEAQDPLRPAVLV